MAVEAAAAVGENNNNKNSNNAALVLINGQLSAKNDQIDQNSNSANQTLIQTSINHNLIHNNLILPNQQDFNRVSSGVSHRQFGKTSKIGDIFRSRKYNLFIENVFDTFSSSGRFSVISRLVILRFTSE